MRQYNNLTVEAYSSGTTRVSDPDSELSRAGSVRFSTGYPGGLYLEAEFTVPRDVIRWWKLNGAQRVVIKNGLKIVYEGYITDLSAELDEDQQGTTVSLVGPWARYLMSRRWRKRWADQRFDEDLWIYNNTSVVRTYTNSTGTFNQYEDGGDEDHNNRLKLNWNICTPSGNDFIACTYTMPPGEVIRKISYTYKMVGSNQRLVFYNATTGWGMIANTAGQTSVIQTYTPASGINSIEFQLMRKTTQRVDDVNAYYGYLLNLTVYGGEAAGNPVTLSQVAKDIVSRFTDFNSDTRFIDSNTKDLTPFITDDYPTLADILTQAASFGDADNNRWACGCLPSDLAATPDGKPVMSVEQQPALTDYDYAIRLDENNVIAPFSIVKNWDDLYNYVIVEYQDKSNRTKYITPNDDVTLKDTVSIALYGQRDALVSIGDSTAELALSNGQRTLAARKDPQWKVSTPIRLRGYARAKDGQRVPVSYLTAGKRIKIEDYINDASGTGLTFLISHTTYEDEDETCTISIGPPDDLIYPYFSFGEDAQEDPAPGGPIRRKGSNRLNDPYDSTWEDFGYGNKKKKKKGRTYDME